MISADRSVTAPTILLDRAPPTYAPGDAIRVETPAGGVDGAQTIELSVVWCTVGKGDEDLVVHDFRRVAASELAGEPLVLETVLPKSPMSYAGRVVKVCWSARLRVYLGGGKQLANEVAFRLGNVEAAKPNEQDRSEPAAEDAR